MSEGAPRHAACKPLFPYPRPELSGRIKSQPDDFRVVEQLGFEPDGDGEHLFLYLRKTGLTTPQLVDQVCRSLDVSPRQAGYSGLKDKHAVTEQWISVHLPGCSQIPHIDETNQYQILDARWHRRKLRVGSHRSNRFDIRVRDIGGDAHDAGLTSVGELIVQGGFANYFGDQRFGSAGDNITQALRMLGSRHKSKRLSRHRRSLYLSAIRSELFNRILARRIADGIWTAPMPGDVFMLEGSHSIFSEDLSEPILRRYTELDLHSALSLYGLGDSRVSKEARAIEDAVFSACSDLTEILQRQQVAHAYRASRAQAHDLQLEFDHENRSMRLQVELERGVYLTTLLGHMLDFEDGSGDGGNLDRGGLSNSG